MTQDDNVKDRIQEFYQLWQEQLASVNQDPDIAKTMFTMGEQAYASMNQFMQHAQKHDHADTTDTKAQPKTHPSADTDLSGDGDHAIARLYARIIACEERIAQLESQLASQGKKA